MAIEKPSYRVVERRESLEIREYAPTLVAETAVGEPIWARYDPPFMPWFLRTNEILVDLAPGKP